ncbi:MAG: alpha-L-fucosidase [Bacilli bacterium]|nr:alpha-L-fucosidase [Bacilli bacterium]
MDKWYKGVYRRNLVDMHINDDNDLYLSRFSPVDYFNYLKNAKIQSPMIYLQAHTGLCYFPSKVCKTHKYFQKHPHAIKELIDLCKKDDMKVVGYYSLIYNNEAVISHPEWECKYENGDTYRSRGQRYGLACPNNSEYRQFVQEQIKEMAEEYNNLDGLFFDMPFWSFPCYCESCQKRYQKEYGVNPPTIVDFSNPEYLRFTKARQLWMGEFTQFVKKETNKYFPNTTVEFNFAAVIGCDYTAGSTELINETCEFAGGDLYGDLYNHSFVCKYYYQISNNQPFEYMTCRCNDLLREHTINKPLIQLENEIMLSAMHHAASLIIDAIDPDGSLDYRVSDTLSKAFSYQIPYEPFMDKGELFGEIAIYFDSGVQFDYLGHKSNKEVAINLSKTLIENHIPYHIIANGHLNNLNRYKMIFAPSLFNFDNNERLKLIDYVNNGGLLYLSSYADKRLLKEFFDGEIIGQINRESPYPIIDRGFPEVFSYIYPVSEKYQKYFEEFNEKYPLPLRYYLPEFKFNVGEVTAKIIVPFTDPNDSNKYASIHSNPPGIKTEYPAIVEAKYGKGKVIYSVAPLEGEGRINYKEIIKRIIFDNYDPLIKVKTSKYVESIIFKDNEDYYINLVDLNFFNEVVTRNYEINLPNIDEYEFVETISNKKISPRGTFEKYVSIHLKRKK